VAVTFEGFTVCEVDDHVDVFWIVSSSSEWVELTDEYWDKRYVHHHVICKECVNSDPEDLTDGVDSTNKHPTPGAGSSDQRDVELDLFAVRLESPEDERC